MNFILLTVFVLLSVAHQAQSHGWMNKPPMRGSMWRFPTKYPEVATPINEHDNALRAGGPFYVGINNDLLDRKFGVCGDRFTDPVPREHESGGTFGRFPTLGRAAISECYAPGADIDIDIEITANHGGIFLYELCVPGAGNDETEECFQNGYTLEKSDGTGTEYTLPSTGGGLFTMKYKLPVGVTCDNGARCILRWYWLTSNAPRFGSNILEEYWNCADIEISNNCDGQATPATQTPTPSASPTNTATKTPTPSVTPTNPTTSTDTVDPSPSSQPSASTQPSPSAAPSTSSLPTSSPTPTKSPVPAKDCSCNEGYCPTGTCDNCLLVYGPGNNSRLCYVGFPESACVPTYQNLVWCGSE